MSFWSTVGGAALSAVAPGVGGYLSTISSNASNARAADKSMAFSADMSNTAHQREVEDLRKAGLNPLLSMNGGASTPGGTMSVSQPYKSEKSDIGNYLSNAIEARRLKKEIDALSSQTSLNEKLGKKADAESARTDVETSNLKSSEQRMKADNEFNWKILGSRFLKNMKADGYKKFDPPRFLNNSVIPNFEFQNSYGSDRAGP